MDQDKEGNLSTAASAVVGTGAAVVDIAKEGIEGAKDLREAPLPKPYPQSPKRLGKRLANEGHLRRRRPQANEARSNQSEPALPLAHGGPQKSLRPENLPPSPQRKLEAPQLEELSGDGPRASQRLIHL